MKQSELDKNLRAVAKAQAKTRGWKSVGGMPYWQSGPLLFTLVLSASAKGSSFFASLRFKWLALDNMLWRVAALTGAFTFVGITGDIRRDLFRHLTGHSPTFFSDRQPGTLASRITATSNAIFTVENMFVFNVMPPTVAAFGSIAYIATVNLTMAGILAGVFAAVVVLMFKMASAGKPLHHDFAAKAASVDGEMVDDVHLRMAAAVLSRAGRRSGAELDPSRGLEA